MEESMYGVSAFERGYPEFVEVDPTGRYGRYNEILGKGASKTVYRAFDEYEGIEVAWNQVKLHDFLRNPEDLERLYCEIHLLKTLKHRNIMKFYASWVDTANRNINFVTEMFTSGTLRQLKHRRVHIRAVKHWCRQILKGLLYLHNLSPPVIHRDLKCDNIFINGNQGEVKIGDLGLAAILRKSHAERCVGTPEFMAPEVYEEEYNELVDIYSFGMCILEMVTFEYPYSECTHAAQIYKKVISGKKPEALYKVEDLAVRGFVEKCLATVSHRFTARELLEDPFLQTDEYGCDSRAIEYETEFDKTSPFLTQPYCGIHQNSRSLVNGYGCYLGYEPVNILDCNQVEHETTEAERLGDVDITIQGRRREDDGIFLRLRIADKEGRIRNIYFPFDIENDTALGVATEMVNELDLTDQDVTRIANMIDGEISTLVPEGKRGFESEENEHCLDDSSTSFCHNCVSNGSQLMDYVTPENSGDKNLQVLQCSKHGCTAIHGRFEEITYQVEGSDAPEHCQSNGLQYTDIWAQRDGPEYSSELSRDIYCDEANDSLDMSNCGKEERIITMDNESESNGGKFCSSIRSHSRSASLDECGNVIRQELRWLKAKYQLQLRELRDQRLRLDQKPPSLVLSPDRTEHRDENESSIRLGSPLLSKENKRPVLKPSSSLKLFGSNFRAKAEKCSNSESIKGSCSPDQMFTAKSFHSRDFLHQPLHRATSLPVDAIDF